MTVPPYPPYLIPQPYPAMPPAPTKAHRWTAWRIADLIATLVLFAVYAVELLALLYLSLFWAMATDSCGSGQCDYSKLDNAYFLNDIVGIAVFCVTAVVAIVLLCLRKPAFWLPILGGGIQIALLLAASAQLAGINPS